MLVGGRLVGGSPRWRSCCARIRSTATATVAAATTVAAALAAALVVAVTAAVTLVGAGPTAAAGSTFVVDSTGDGSDANSGDGVCRIAGSSRCTLRAAIEQANASPGHDRIVFSIPGAGPHRLRPAARYPIIDDPAGVTIDGYTEPGAAVNTAAHGSNAVIKIELQGTGPTGIDGLYMNSGHNVVRGLALFDFRRTIYIRTASAVDNEIVGNFVGTNASGTFGRSARVINSTGVHLERGASRNRIGKAGKANRNVISGNGDRGVAIFDEGTDANTIRNNVIGLAPNGFRLRNWGHGIDINYNASDNIVGGRSTGDRNVLSGNELSGVEISHDRSGGTTSGNQVLGNLIGTDLAGVTGSPSSRNHEFGVNLEGKASCPSVSSCTPDINRNVVDANTIVGSAAGVMIWKGAHDNVVRNNRIGVLPNGAIAASSGSTIWGVLIEAGAFDNLVETNTIAGVGDGIQVRPDNDYTNLSANPDIPTFGNTFRRNSIFAVGGFGIDIAPIGVVNGSPGNRTVQGGIVKPTITSATEDRVTVSTCANCLVELFIAESGSQTYRPGRTFVAEGRASSGGSATLRLRSRSSDPLVIDAGDRVTATATDRAGNTSEFSARRTVTPGTVGAPTPRLRPAVRCGAQC